MNPTPLILSAAGTPQTPTPVILSGARTSRSEVLAESKDPYSLPPLHDCVWAFSLCVGLHR